MNSLGGTLEIVAMTRKTSKIVIHAAPSLAAREKAARVSCERRRRRGGFAQVLPRRKACSMLSPSGETGLGILSVRNAWPAMRPESFGSNQRRRRQQ